MAPLTSGQKQLVSQFMAATGANEKTAARVSRLFLLLLLLLPPLLPPLLPGLCGSPFTSPHTDVSCANQFLKNANYRLDVAADS